MIQKLYILILLLAFGFSVEGECIEGNCQNGQGTLTHPDGSTYVGEYKDGLFDGWGILTKANGTSKIGIWFNDNFVEEKTFTEVINYLKAKHPDSEILEGY